MAASNLRFISYIVLLVLSGNACLSQVDTSKVKIIRRNYYEYNFKQRECFPEASDDTIPQGSMDSDTVYTDSIIGDIKAISFPVVHFPDQKLSKFINDTIRKLVEIDELTDSPRKLNWEWDCIVDKPSEFYVDYQIEFLNSRFLSLTISSDGYAGGGANGSSHDLSALTFDFVKRRLLLLKDVINGQKDTTVYNIVIAQIKSERPDLFDQWGEDHNPNLFHFTSTLDYPIVIKNDRVIIYWYIGWGGRGGDEAINLHFDKNSAMFKTAFLAAVKSK